MLGLMIFLELAYIYVYESLCNGQTYDISLQNVWIPDKVSFHFNCFMNYKEDTKFFKLLSDTYEVSLAEDQRTLINCIDIVGYLVLM